MSRVYNKIKFDMETWKVLEEDSYEYNGLWAYCDGTNADSTSVSSSSISSSSSSTYCLNLSPNRARGGTATASSELPGLNAYEAFDGIVAYWNSWAAAGTDQTAWIKYDFGSGIGRQIEKIKIYGQQQNYPDRVIVHGSFNDSTWFELTDQTMSWPVPTAYQYTDFAFFNFSSWRYIRLSFPDQPWVRASEIELYECLDTTSSSSSSLSSSLSSSSSSFSSSSSSGIPPSSSSSSSSSSLSSSSSSYSGSSSSSSSSLSISSSSSSLSSSSSYSSSSSSSSLSFSSSSSSQSAGQYAYFGYNTLSPYPGDHHGVTLDDDSRVPNLNAVTLNVRRNINYIKTGLINFDLKWMADSTSQVVNTFLHLKTTSTVPGGFPISVHEVKKSWTGSQVDWIDRNSSGEWSIVARGALDTDVDTEPVPLDTITPTEANTWYRWDVTSGILDILANQDLTNNRGFILRYPREGGTAVFGETIFHGNDAASDDDKPYVVIALRDFQILSSSSSSSSSSISSSSSSSTSISSCAVGYFETIGPTNWIVNTGTWNGTYYWPQANGHWKTFINTTGSLWPGFRPLKMKLTFTIVGWQPILAITLRNTEGNTIASASNINTSSPVSFDITYDGTADIGELEVEDDGSFGIIGVEFYEDCGTSSFSSSSISSSLSSSSSSSSLSSSSSISSSVSSSSLSSSSESVASGDNFFDDSYWEPYNANFAAWDNPNQEWDANPPWVNFVLIEPTNSVGSPNFGWEVGYTNNTARITVDNITGGSSTFAFTLQGNSVKAEVLGIPISNGQSYDLDISSVDAPFIYLGVTNSAGSDTQSITNIEFLA